MTDSTDQWRRFERSSDAYLTVTILLFLLIVLPILAQSSPRMEGIISAVIIGAAVTLSMAASNVRRWAIHISWIAGLVVLVAVLFEGTPDEVRITAAVILAVGMLATPAVILRRIGSHDQVSATTIWGAIAAYLAFGLAFSLMYSAVYQADPGAFANMADPRLGDTNYFSFVTMTTLGYGDITPLTAIPRALVVMQTLVGQIYLVVVVARVVSLLGRPYTKLSKVESD